MLGTHHGLHDGAARFEVEPFLGLTFPRHQFPMEPVQFGANRDLKRLPQFVAIAWPAFGRCTQRLSIIVGGESSLPMADEFVIFRVWSDPEPHDIRPALHGQRPVVQTNPYRPEGANPLEV